MKKDTTEIQRIMRLLQARLLQATICQYNRQLGRMDKILEGYNLPKTELRRNRKYKPIISTKIETVILKLPTKVKNQMVLQVNSVEHLRVNTCLSETFRKHFRGRPLSLRPLYPHTKIKENMQRKLQRSISLMNMDTKVFDKMPPI